MCYEIEVFQQIIDGTYEGDIDEVISHIEACPHCKERYEKLKEEEKLVEEALNNGMVIPERRQIIEKENKRRGFKMSKVSRKWAVAAAVALVFTSVIFVEPINAKAQQLLKIFRVKEMKTVSINASDIREINEIFRRGNGSKEIEDFIKVDVSSSDKEIQLQLPTKGKIKKEMPNAEVLPLKENLKYSYACIYPKNEITMKLNVNKANDFLNYLGEKTKLPQALDNKTFTIASEEVLRYRIDEINKKEDQYNQYISVTQMKAPTIKIPSDVDENQLIETLLSMSLLPDNLKQQFMGINNLTSTVPIVYDAEKQTKEEIRIRGEKAIVINSKDNSGYSIYFKEDEVLYYIMSNYNLDEVLAMVEEMN